MKKERGFTLVEVLVVLTIVSVSSIAVVPRLIASHEQSQEISLDADRATLKTKCSIYYLNNAEHAVKTMELTSLMDAETTKFVNWISESLGLPLETATTYDVIDKRFGWVSSQKLIDEKLLDTIPSDDRYILDKETYTVYHVLDAEDVWKELYQSSSSHTNSLSNMTIRRFPIEISASIYMDKVNTTCMAGNVIYAGGNGTLKLAKIEITATTQTIKDISSSLANVREVYGVSNIGSGLRVEYLDTSNKLVITDISY